MPLLFALFLPPFVQCGDITDANIFWLAWHLLVGGPEFQTFTHIGKAAGTVTLTMWIILRRLGHSWHALIIMLCVSAVRLNRGLQQPNASIVPALLCDAVKKKK